MINGIDLFDAIVIIALFMGHEMHCDFTSSTDGILGKIQGRNRLGSKYSLCIFLW